MSYATMSSAPATPVRMAMVGGGVGAFIGPVHRLAATLDGLIEITAGAFSSDPDRNHETGRHLRLDENRVYDTYQTLIEKEALLPVERRSEFVAIVTPNHLHVPVALCALSRGFPVLCEKPLSRTLPEALSLRQAVDSSALLFGMTYTYLGYPLVREARALVASGAIGRVRRIAVSYTQGWLARSIEKNGDRQAAWRTDPATAGTGGAMGDIGVHAQSLLEYVAGQSIAEVSADIRTALPGRLLDDDGAVLLRLANGARGTLIASQVCAGDENRLELRVYGDKGSLHWEQENPNRLWHRSIDDPARLITANPSLMTDPIACEMLRLPGGHPEGYIEALANIYRSFAWSLRSGSPAGIPGAADGVHSIAFIEAVVASSHGNGRWQQLAA